MNVNGDVLYSSPKFKDIYPLNLILLLFKSFTLICVSMIILVTRTKGSRGLVKIQEGKSEAIPLSAQAFRNPKIANEIPQILMPIQSVI